METKIMLAAAIFFGGWLWSYLFIRQLLFNFRVAYPLIRSMNSLREDLIAVGAKRYTGISVAICLVFSLAVLAVVIRFCPVYLIVSFLVGAVSAIAFLVGRTTVDNRDMFDSFCNAYCRFVPDDELRNAMYNKKTGLVKSRLKAMGIEGNFVPVFDPRKATKKEDKK